MSHPHAATWRVAEELVALLQPACGRIIIAGSLRRQKPLVKDIEIVCAPRWKAVENLFGEQIGMQSDLDALVEQLLDQGQLRERLDKNGRAALGQRYLRLWYQERPVDLFAVLPPSEWGLQVVLRTGPADFSHRLVTPRRFKGGMPDGWRVTGAHIENERGELVPTPEEADVFRVLGIPYIDPPDRR